MVFIWILFVSTAILFARYCKQCWPDRRICSKPIWFAAHRAIMLFAAGLTVIGFVLILIYKSGTWVSRNRTREFVHSILGIIVISASVIQPFMALFRCKPNDKNRFIFNYAHASVGLIAFILSIVTIFLIMFSTQISFQFENAWNFLVAWICWIVVIFAVFECVDRCLHDKQKSEEKNETHWMDIHTAENEVNKVDDSSTNELFIKDRVKTVLLVVHFLVALGLSLALAIVIGQSS
ncbi:unnamed protein product [Rotaria sp. Silwood1]|nr:unnamed protein product [Rotaria sp. Silwood1]